MSSICTKCQSAGSPERQASLPFWYNSVLRRQSQHCLLNALVACHPFAQAVFQKAIMPPGSPHLCGPSGLGRVFRNPAGLQGDGSAYSHERGFVLHLLSHASAQAVGKRKKRNGQTTCCHGNKNTKLMGREYAWKNPRLSFNFIYIYLKVILKLKHWLYIYLLHIKYTLFRYNIKYM